MAGPPEAGRHRRRPPDAAPAGGRSDPARSGARPGAAAVRAAKAALGAGLTKDGFALLNRIQILEPHELLELQLRLAAQPGAFDTRFLRHLADLGHLTPQAPGPEEAIRAGLLAELRYRSELRPLEDAFLARMLAEELHAKGSLTPAPKAAQMALDVGRPASRAALIGYLAAKASGAGLTHEELAVLRHARPIAIKLIELDAQRLIAVFQRVAAQAASASELADASFAAPALQEISTGAQAGPGEHSACDYFVVDQSKRPGLNAGEQVIWDTELAIHHAVSAVPRPLVPQNLPDPGRLPELRHRAAEGRAHPAELVELGVSETLHDEYGRRVLGRLAALVAKSFREELRADEEAAVARLLEERERLAAMIPATV